MADDFAAELWDYGEEEESPINAVRTAMRAAEEGPEPKRFKACGAAVVLLNSDDDDDFGSGSAEGPSAVEEDATAEAGSAAGPGSGRDMGAAGGAGPGAHVTGDTGTVPARAGSKNLEDMLDPATKQQWERTQAALERLKQAAVIELSDSDDTDESSVEEGVPPALHNTVNGSGRITGHAAALRAGPGPGSTAAAAAQETGGAAAAAGGAAAVAGTSGAVHGGMGGGVDDADDQGEAAKVELKVQCAKGAKTFRIGSRDPLSKLFAGFGAWADSQGWLPPGTGVESLKYYFDDEKLNGQETCESLDCDGGEAIDVTGL